MYTRKQYMNDKVSHEDYYGQFVTHGLVALVKQAFLSSPYWKSTDDFHLNDCGISIKKWEQLGAMIPSPTVKKICEANSSTSGGRLAISISDRVCTLKAAGRIAQQEIMNEKEG